MARQLQLENLTPTQQRVIAALVQGATITAAAGANSVDRTTVHYWCRSNPAFRAALARARQIHAENVREELRLLSGTAIETLRTLLTDPATPASTRLRAAIAVLEHTSRPEPAPMDVDVEQAIYDGVCKAVGPEVIRAATATAGFQHISTLSTSAEIVEPFPPEKAAAVSRTNVPLRMER